VYYERKSDWRSSAIPQIAIYCFHEIRNLGKSMKLSAILEPLIAAGIPGEVILATVRAYEEQAGATSEEGKEKARQRWRRWKNKQNANVGKRLPTDTNVSNALTHGEGSSSNQEISEKEEKKETSLAARSRGTRIPDDFRPDIEAAVSEGLSRQEAERQALTFCDYWRSKPGKDALKLDWPATWRIWFRRRLNDRPNSTSPPPPRPPRNAGEAARLELSRRETINAPSTQIRHDDQSDGGPGFAGSGIARRIALAASR
jgi:hypothetical protein